jgi:hypothetical protein
MDAGGLLYSGDSDAAVRVWQTKDVLYVGGERARGRYVTDSLSACRVGCFTEFDFDMCAAV